MNNQPFAKPPRWWSPKVNPRWVHIWRLVRLREQRAGQRLVHIEVNGVEHVQAAAARGDGVLEQRVQELLDAQVAATSADAIPQARRAAVRVAEGGCPGGTSDNSPAIQRLSRCWRSCIAEQRKRGRAVCWATLWGVLPEPRSGDAMSAQAERSAALGPRPPSCSEAPTGNAVNDFPAGKRGVGNVAAVARPRVHPE